HAAPEFNRLFQETLLLHVFPEVLSSNTHSPEDIAEGDTLIREFNSKIGVAEFNDRGGFTRQPVREVSVDFQCTLFVVQERHPQKQFPASVGVSDLLDQSL